jgi:hypothetical protein
VRCSISSDTKGEPAELSSQGGAGSTAALPALHEAALASPTLCPDPKKARRRSVAGKGESMLVQSGGSV